MTSTPSRQTHSSRRFRRLMRHLLEEGAEAVERFAREPGGLLVLDFDGTVAPFAPTPERHSASSETT